MNRTIFLTTLIATLIFVHSPQSFAVGESSQVIDENSYLNTEFEIRYGDTIMSAKLRDFIVQDSDTLNARNIHRLFPDLEKKVQNASLIIDNGKYTITPSQTGIRVNLDRFGRDLESMREARAVHPVTLHFITIPARTTEEDVRSALEEVKSRLSKNISLDYEEFNYVFKPLMQSEMLEINFVQYLTLGDRKFPVSLITKDEKADELLTKNWMIEIQKQKLNGLIDEAMADKLDRKSQDVRIYYDEAGKIAFDGTAQDGRLVDRQKLHADLTHALNTTDITSVIPEIHPVKGKVEVTPELEAMGIKELVAVGYSNFQGSSPARIKNVKSGLAKYNGLIMKKGEVFSFNEHLGPVDAANGFTEELVIKGDRTVKEMGGGLCQVSSTFYRAGLYAGLPITERKGHSYAVQYYARPGGHGLDCTIYPGVADCKMLNDMPSDLVIQAYSDGLDAYFKFYGTKDDRTVSLDGPHISNQQSAPAQKTVYDSSKPADYYEVKEHPHAGFTALWTRTVTKAGQTLNENFVTKYQARPQVIIRGGSEASPATQTSGSEQEFSS